MTGCSSGGCRRGRQRGIAVTDVVVTLMLVVMAAVAVYALFGDVVS